MPAAGTVNKYTDVITASQKGSPQSDKVVGTRFSFSATHALTCTCARRCVYGKKKTRKNSEMQMCSENKIENLKDAVHTVNLFPGLRTKIRGNTPLN